MEDENILIKTRLEKLKELKKLKINPYPYNYKVTHKASQILEQFKDIKKEEKTSTTVSIAGRILSLRVMGRATFGHLQDSTDKIQFYLKEDILGKDNYKLLKKLDIGDIIGIEGLIFRTKLGEITIEVHKIELLTKALRPLPEKWHGLKDTEIRYRQRYLDLIMNQDTKETFIKRAQIITTVREFLDNNGFIEVEIPTLQPLYGGANARPFKTKINAWNMDMYLSISPELYLKRLVVGGLDKVYTICKNFRNEGIDKTHNPEFTMMECYQAYADYNDIMELIEDLYIHVAKKVLGKTKFTYQGHEINLKKPWPKLTMAEALKKYTNLETSNLELKELEVLLRNYNIEYEGSLSKGVAIQLLFEHLAEDKVIQPTHIIDHPRETSPLAKDKRGNSNFTERVEPYIMGWEVGNGFSELNDPIKQKQIFQEQEKQGRAGSDDYHPMDKDYVKALEYGLPPTGGLGIGIDRMVMLFTNSITIRDVILFPTMKNLRNNYSF